MRLKRKVKFAADITVHYYNVEHTFKPEYASNPIRPITYSFPVRVRSFNVLSHGHPDGIHVVETSVEEQHLPPRFINVVIDEETGEVQIPVILDEVMGEISAVVDLVTVEKKEYRYLIKHIKIKEMGDPAMGAEIDRLVDTDTIYF